MALSTEEILQYLEGLRLPEETGKRCRELAKAQQYDAVWQTLRCVRTQFLQEMHTAQERLDRLDRLIYDIRKKKEEDRPESRQPTS